MCFNRLPIEFDHSGRASLRPGGWGAARDPERVVAALTSEAHREFTVAPVTRIAGAMDFQTKLDLPNRRVVDARASAAAFRGYEVLLRGRDPREAMEISSRVCGVCGGVHSTTSSMALDMAFPVVPPPLGIIARNIAQAAELLYDHILHICLLAGPDYSERMSAKAEPTIWRRAEGAKAAHREHHGKATIADIMRALNPLHGELYLDSFRRTRAGMQMVAAMVGAYPHPTTMVPGGINVILTRDSFLQVRALADELLDFVKKLIWLFEDLMSFYEEARPEFSAMGERPANLICFGRYDDVESYDGRYDHMDAWARARSNPPGVIIDGKIRTTSLQAINLGIEEFVDHSFYERWGGSSVPADPLGAPLSPFHPWNKETIPKPEARDWKEKYTWSTAPRWDREVVEAGPIARNWMLALAGSANQWDGTLDPTPAGVRFTLPKGAELPEAHFEWKTPTRLNTIERNRARVYHLGITWLQVALDCQRGLDLISRGERRVWTRSTIPNEGIGAGFWEASRGALGHWLTLEEQVVKNYQMITPSAFNASPRDPWGHPGPYEEAAMNTPILEEFSSEAEFIGLDIMRTVRSFDPCMPCAVHMDTGEGIVTRQVVSCICGSD
ncbi:MAG: nickel-dependent hydrogenase large subunit [Gemmatimonadaceae bacterium]